MKRVYCAKHIQYWEKVCLAFSDFVGTVENLSERDKSDFEGITGFKVSNLLESYSSLINGNALKQELDNAYDALCKFVDIIENMTHDNQNIFEDSTGFQIQDIIDARYTLYHALNQQEE